MATALRGHACHQDMPTQSGGHGTHQFGVDDLSRALPLPVLLVPRPYVGCWMDVLERADPAVWEAIQGERRRQQDGLEMIASENYTSPAGLAAQGSVLTHK